jgi:hypothetical protein
MGGSKQHNREQRLSSGLKNKVKVKEASFLKGNSPGSPGTASCSKAFPSERIDSASSLLVNTSWTTRYPHYASSQENHNLRFTGGCSTTRCDSGAGGSSDVVTTTSANSYRRCGETSLATGTGVELCLN